MSSYKRIPGKNIIKTDEKVSINDEFVIQEKLYKKEVSDRFLEEAQKEVLEKKEIMISEMENEKEKIIKEAKKEGERIALEEARKSLEDEFLNKMKLANYKYEEANSFYQNLIKESDELMQKFISEKKEELIEIVILSVKKTINHEIEEENINIENIFKDALKEIKYETKKIFIRINPEVYPILNDYREKKMDKRIEFVFDMNLNKADFVLETDREFLDFTINNQLDELKEYLKECFR